MLILKENEVCPYSNICPHNKNRTCSGSYTNRTGKFTCTLVNGSGQFNENTQFQKNQYDETGNMQVIME